MKELTFLFILSALIINSGCGIQYSLNENSNDISQEQMQEVADDSQLDSDSDGLTDMSETQMYLTDPYDADTDDDGYSDSVEVASGYDPLTSADAITEKTEYDVTNEGEGISIISDTETTTFNCGTDESCINEKFANCEPAILTSNLGDWVAVSYEITGPVVNGCSITFMYTINPNSKWVNQPMYCVVQTSSDFTATMQSAIENTFSGGASCTGPLADIVHGNQ